MKGLQSTLSVWYLGLASELLFVGDAGTTEAGRPSRRVGVEWTNYARLASWLTVDGDLSFSRARFTEDDPAGDYIPGALDRVVAAGVTVEPQKRVFGSLRVRHFGPRPLIEDASVKSRATTLWNAEGGYRLSSRGPHRAGGLQPVRRQGGRHRLLLHVPPGGGARRRAWTTSTPTPRFRVSSGSACRCRSRGWPARPKGKGGARPDPRRSPASGTRASPI